MPREKHSTQEEKYTTVKKFDTIFANRLSALITARKKGMSTEQLAKDLGVTVRVIQLWEGRQSRPDIERLSSIADYFGVTVDYLVGRSSNSASTIEKAAICDYTGLSDRTVEKFVQMNKYDNENWLMFIFNHIVSSEKENFMYLIGVIADYAMADENEVIDGVSLRSIKLSCPIKRKDVVASKAHDTLRNMMEELRLKMDDKKMKTKWFCRFYYGLLREKLDNKEIDSTTYNEFIALLDSGDYKTFKEKEQDYDNKIQ